MFKIAIKLFKNQYIFSMFSKFSLAFLGLINSILINRYLGPALKGEYAFILNSVNILVLILNLGIYQSYPFFKRQNIEGLKEKYINNVSFQFALYFSITVILSFVFKDINYSIVFTLVPFMILTRQLSFITLVERINIRNLVNITSAAAYTLILIVVYIFTEVDYVYVIVALYFKDIIIIASLILVFRLKPNLTRPHKEMLIQSIKYGIGPMFTLLLINLNYKADVIILKVFVENYQIGLYSIGILLAEQAWLISDAFKEVLFSKTSRSDSVNETIRAIKLNVYINILMLVFVLIFGKQIITLLYGVEFVDAYLVTSVIFAGITGMVLFKLIYPYFISKGMQMITVKYLLVVALVNILLNFVLIPQFGNIGAAIASVVSYNICGLLFVISFKNKTQTDYISLLRIDKHDIEVVKKFFNSKRGD
jgi:O-antigen/teichoic acid export membrane protein